MMASPINYVNQAKLRGAIFDHTNNGLVSGVDTEFYVDHEEPMAALHEIRQSLKWPLGDLPEGHEFLLVLSYKPVQHHRP